MVIMAIRRSSHSDALRTYQSSNFCFSSLVTSLAPLTWAHPLIPVHSAGFGTRDRERLSSLFYGLRIPSPPVLCSAQRGDGALQDINSGSLRVYTFSLHHAFLFFEATLKPLFLLCTCSVSAKIS